MRILVTGGAGYIGSHTVRLLLSRGHQVWVYDNLSYGHTKAVPAGCLVVGDLADAPAVEKLFRVQHIEAVVHFAAFVSVADSVRQPEIYYRNNLINALNLLGAMQRSGVSKFVFSSTCATYGIPLKVPITEDEPQKPITPYGRSKLAVEWALADFAAAYGVGYAALRYFNASGASPAGDIGEDHDPEIHLIPLMLQTALGRRPHIEIYGTDYPTPDGTCIRDYIHVDDLANAHLLALERLQPGKGLAYNLGIGKGYSVREVIRAAEEVTGRTIKVKEGPRRSGDPAELVAASHKARRELGWQPRYQSIHDIVATAWKWHQGHPNGYED